MFHKIEVETDYHPDRLVYLAQRIPPADLRKIAAHSGQETDSDARAGRRGICCCPGRPEKQIPRCVPRPQETREGKYARDFARDDNLLVVRQGKFSVSRSSADSPTCP